MILPPAAPAAAGGFALHWPVDCTLGQDCHIQQYVDHDPGPGAQDFTCSGLSYDGHKGTDIALPYLSSMDAGVRVLAAADGVVAGTRDGMADRYAAGESAEAVKGRECGNGLVIRHADGWETQYCHLKKGSLLVRNGDRVAAGTPLGDIGLSGMTQFPHLHLSLRKDGKVADPFQAGPQGACGTGGAQAWADPLPYQPGGLTGGGFHTAIPEYEDVKAGRADLSPLQAEAPALVFWTLAYGGRTGDEIRLSATGPDGEVFRQTTQLEKPQAQLFRAAGKRLKAERWPAGTYSGTAVLIRDGKEISRYSQQMDIR
jgi:hypothetical protein